MAACFHPTYDHPRCGPHDECPAGDLCIAKVCESMSDGVLDMRTFDSASLQAGDLDDMTIDAATSSLTPNAYTYGGLIGHGLDGVKLWAGRFRIPGARYLQLRVDMTSNGVAEPELRVLSIAFQRDPGGTRLPARQRRRTAHRRPIVECSAP